MIAFPNCKINLGLQVMRRREDGYHDLETIFIPVPLCDEIEIAPSEAFSFQQEGIAIDGDAEKNLVVRAYRLMQKEKGIGNVAIRLKKNIPFGAGLGGGSSDAAFTLKMLNEMFDMGLSNEKLKRLASTLGADCAFFIDNEPSFACGIGDELTPLGFNPLEGYQLVMVKPDVAVSTAEAYGGIVPRERRTENENLSQKAQKKGELVDVVRRPIAEWEGLVVNDFEQTVFAKHPLLAEIKERLYDEGALYAAMSGSGATVYGVFEKERTPRMDFDAFIFTTSV